MRRVMNSTRFQKKKHASIVEAHESTRKRLESSLPNNHEDHSAGKGFTYMSHGGTNVDVADGGTNGNDRWWQLTAFNKRLQLSRGVSSFSFNMWQIVHYIDIDISTLTPSLPCRCLPCCLFFFFSLPTDRHSSVVQYSFCLVHAWIEPALSFILSLRKQEQFTLSSWQHSGQFVLPRWWIDTTSRKRSWNHNYSEVTLWKCWRDFVDKRPRSAKCANSVRKEKSPRLPWTGSWIGCSEKRIWGWERNQHKKLWTKKCWYCPLWNQSRTRISKIGAVPSELMGRPKSKH